MTMHYELWHLESSNLLDYFDTESEALEAVRAYDAHGEAEGLELLCHEDEQPPELIASGAQLAELVRRRRAVPA